MTTFFFFENSISKNIFPYLHWKTKKVTLNHTGTPSTEQGNGYAGKKFPKPNYEVLVLNLNSFDFLGKLSQLTFDYLKENNIKAVIFKPIKENYFLFVLIFNWFYRFQLAVIWCIICQNDLN